MELNDIMEVIEDRVKEKCIPKRYLAQIFDMSEKGIWAWFNGKACIPFDKLIKLVDLVNAEIIIRDKNTFFIMFGIFGGFILLTNLPFLSLIITNLKKKFTPAK